MRLIICIVTFLGLATITSCLNDGTAECELETRFILLEIFLLEENGIQYMSPSDSINNAIELCEPITPPDTLGFENIYSANGVIFEECNGSVCSVITEITNPYCEPEYNISPGDYSLFDQWNVDFLMKGSTKIYSSCLQPGLQIQFTSNVDSTEFTGQAVFGVNDFTVSLSPVSANELIVSDKLSTLLASSPYVHLVENELMGFFQINDTIVYSIEDNILTFGSGQNTIRFFHNP